MIMDKFQNQTNALDLAIGFKVDNWVDARRPNDNVLRGNHCRCEPLKLETHSNDLFEAYQLDRENRIWVYLPYGPFDSVDDYQRWMKSACFNGDPFFYAIVDSNTGKAIGVASYLRITPNQGSIEVGHINYSPLLQNSIAATEAMYLMMDNAFAMGYRRYEWKCNALNEKSCSAALRLGFTFEGIFRQMMIVKGRNRDSAWYSLLDREWPVIDLVFQQWLSPENFDSHDQQKTALSHLTRNALAASNSDINDHA